MIEKLDLELESSPQILVEKIFNVWKRDKYCVVNFLYYSNYVLLKGDYEYRKAIDFSTLLFPDGIGMQILYKLKYKTSLPNLNGTDFIPHILEYSSNINLPIAIYGSSEKNLSFFKSNLYDNYKIDPYLSVDGYNNLVFSSLKNKSLLLVGRGSPLQEKWVFQNSKKIIDYEILVITVGGFFDYFSPENKRAPKFIRKMKLEFLFRFLQSPRKNLKKFTRNFYLITDIFK